MLKKILSFFTAELSQEDGRDFNQNQRQLATAALLIEVAKVDQTLDDDEFNTLKSVLADRFQLDPEQLDELTAMAEMEQEQASSLYQFTQLINQECRPAEKFELLKAMWEVAYADGELDKYEEHLIRKVAELIYVPHSEFIRAKLEVRNSLNGDDPKSQAS